MKAAFVILTIATAAWLASHQHKSQGLLIDEASAATIVCNPRPTPELVRWYRKKVQQT